jgi:hypothetical protein
MAIGVVALALVIGAVALGRGAARGAAPRFNASGSVHCTATGKGRFTPGATTAPRAAVVWKLTAQLRCSGSTGNGSVAIRTGRMRASSSPGTRTCSGGPLPTVRAVVKWKADGGRINPTQIAWSSGRTGTSSSRITTDFPGSGSAVVTGSYAGAASLAHFVSAPVSLAPCSTPGGLRRYAIAGTSTLDLTGGGPASACNNGQAAPAQYQSVVVFAFENRTWSSVGGPGFGGMPYLRALAQKCSYFTSWTETNTSQNSLTQYGGQVTGAFQPGLVNDCSPSATCSTTANNIFRQARAAAKTAINYVEGATTGCSASGNAAKHIPTLYMWGADDRTHCAAQTRPYSEFNPNNLPNFAFVTPTECNDGHDCPNSTVDNWARTHVQRVLDSSAYRAGRVAVFIWYDEDAPVPNMQIAPTARPGPFGTSGIGYASTLKAWQSMLGFPCLANACTAPNLRSVAGV